MNEINQNNSLKSSALQVEKLKRFWLVNNTSFRPKFNYIFAMISEDLCDTTFYSKIIIFYAETS